METIEERAFQSEAMGLRLGAACKSKFVVRTLERNARAAPSTKEDVAAVRLCAAPPGYLSIDIVSSFFLKR